MRLTTFIIVLVGPLSTVSLARVIQVRDAIPPIRLVPSPISGIGVATSFIAPADIDHDSADAHGERSFPDINFDGDTPASEVTALPSPVLREGTIATSTLHPTIGACGPMGSNCLFHTSTSTLTATPSTTAVEVKEAYSTSTLHPTIGACGPMGNTCPEALPAPLVTRAAEKDVVAPIATVPTVTLHPTIGSCGVMGSSCQAKAVEGA